MSRQWVVILALAAFLGIGLIWLLDHPVPSDSEVEGGLLIPELSAQVNDIQALDIVAPGGAVAVSLRRVGEAGETASLRWRVVQREGYEADFARVFALLRDLAELERSEARTSNPDWYARLGVEHIGSAGAAGRRLDFPLNAISSVIVGQVDPTGQGSYARLQNEQQTWLADRVIELPIDPVQWLEPGIMDIPSDDISQVIVRHADGEMVHLQNSGTERDDFVLLDVPEGRQAGPAFRRTALANGLRSLNLEDVRAYDESLLTESAVRVLFTTKDDLDFVATLIEQEPLEQAQDAAVEAETSWWVHFTVSAAAEVEETSEPDEPTVDLDGSTVPSEAAAENSEREEYNERLVNAVAVDARLSPWLFRIPQRRFDELTVRMNDLLEPLPELEEDRNQQ